MKNNMTNKSATLTARLTRTVVIALIAMSTVWLGFYLYTNNLLKRYVTGNMEMVSSEIISELEESFLQMERMAYALDSDEQVIAFLRENRMVGLADKAGDIVADVTRFQKHGELMEHVVVANRSGNYYRFVGNLDNTSVKKLLQKAANTDTAASFSITLEKSEYIGYVAPLHDGVSVSGMLIMLTSQDAILKLFDEVSDINEMQIALCSDERVIISGNEEYIGRSVDDIVSEGEFYSYARIGFTPFELLISYESAGRELRNWFIVSMVALAVFLLVLFILFLRFWWKKFFVPIQQVISDVEQIEDNSSKKIEPTGLEHFDGLVEGINEMIERVEQKEQEVFEARYSLKEAELRREKALLISLKKQISAHFTVNVLTAIKALASNGENEKAGNLCDGLSYLLRYANSGETDINVMEEFWVLQKYVDIMQIRYPGRFTADIDIEDELEQIMIPRMLLQPIVENSIRHGVVSDIDRPGHIHVFCEVSEDTIRFVIEDNGKGMSETEVSALKEKIATSGETDDVAGLTHVALPNIQRRIESYFGAGYGLDIVSSEDEGTAVTVTLPHRAHIVI